jgi:hypothetical protein
VILDGQIASLSPANSIFRRRLQAGVADVAPEIQAAGSVEALNHAATGLFCSSQCPGSIVLKTFDTISRMRDEGRILIGGFHSVMEQECLSILLRGRQPVVWVPARSIIRMRLKPELVPAFKEDRLLILSPFAPQHSRVTAALSEQRNRFVAALCDRVFIPHAAPNGKTFALAQSLLQAGRQVDTFNDPSNAGLITLGAALID